MSVFGRTLTPRPRGKGKLVWERFVTFVRIHSPFGRAAEESTRIESLQHCGRFAERAIAERAAQSRRAYNARRNELLTNVPRYSLQWRHSA